jgi:hypothetical protein
VKEKLKGRRGMDATTNCETPGDFYRVEERRETLMWRKNDQRRVEFFNASVSRRIEEGERSTRGGSWFP